MNSSPRPVIYGEVLFDCFPNGKQVLGGAPFNVAWNLKALGLDPVFITRVGEDRAGEEILQAMQRWDMDTSSVQRDKTYPTGMVSVSFIDDEPVYDIVENSAWDFIHPVDPAQCDNAAVLYHGSLALRNDVSCQALESLKEGLNSKVFLDVNLRSPYWNKQMLCEQINKSHLLKLNEDELALIGYGSGTLEQRIGQLLKDFNLECVYLTRGEKGAISIDKTGSVADIAPGKKVEVADVVGAGDAFSSVLLLGFIRRWDMPVTLARAQAFAAAVVGLNGATTTDSEFYQQFVLEWNLGTELKHKED